MGVPDELRPYAPQLLLALGVALIALARWASRRRGTRWEPFLTLRIGDVLVTEVVGAFAIGYAIGELAFPDPTRGGAGGPPPPPGRRVVGFGGPGFRPAAALGLALAVVAVLLRVDVRDLFLSGRSSRDPLSSYIGWDARVVAAIPAGGFGEIAMRDASGNIMSVSATADRDIPEGTPVTVVATRELNLVVAPRSPRA